MNIKSVELEIVCGPTSKLPVTLAPEVAFAGRSNVGKSSLINALINRKNLARTSAQPGKTQTINFYNVNRELYFVDLPGYGYARTSRENQEKWADMINAYLMGRDRLAAVFVLVDIRHEAKVLDRQMIDWVRAGGTEPVVIATKADKLSRDGVRKQIAALKKGLGVNKIIPFSAVTKDGKDEIWVAIGELLQ